MEFKKRSDLHLIRKIWHVSAVFVLYLIHYFFSQSWSIGIIVTLTFVATLIDILRLRFSKLNDVILVLGGPLMRDSEVHSLAGTTFLLLGVSFLVMFFQYHIVALSILFLAFVDPFASFIGIKFGKDKIFGRKSIQGFVGGFLICTVISLVYLNINSNLEFNRVLFVSLIAGLLGALAELVPVGKIDDNLTIPVICGIGLELLFKFYGIQF